MKFFDSHFHIIDHHFPVVANQGYLPPNYTSSDYLQQIQSDVESHMDLQLAGGAVVSGSFQLYDQSYLLAALSHLGPGFVGVTQLPEDVSDEELDLLHSGGIRAIRFNINRGVVLSTSITTDDVNNQNQEDTATRDHLRGMLQFAQRLYAKHRWHAEFYIDSRLFLQNPRYYDTLKDLAQLQPIVIDHVAMSYDSFHLLLDLYRSSKHVYVKITGFGRISFTKTQLQESLQTLIDIDSTRLIFGTDLPSTRAKRAFSIEDVQWLHDWFGPQYDGTGDVWNQLMFANAHHLYYELK